MLKKVKKIKKPQEKKIDIKINLFEIVKKRLINQSERYFIIDEEAHSFLLVSKKVHLTVLELNENSIFQPLESKIEKDYWIIFYLKIGVNFALIKDNDFPVYRIREINEIKKVLEEIK